MSIKSALRALNTAYDIAKKVESPEERDHLLSDIAVLTAKVDPTSAVERLEAIADEDARLHATSKVYHAWAAEDAEAAVKHATDLRSAKERSWAMLGVSAGLKDVQRAKTIASAIEDKKAREMALTALGLMRAAANEEELDARSSDLMLFVAERAAIARNDLKAAEAISRRMTADWWKGCAQKELAAAYLSRGDIDAASGAAKLVPQSHRNELLVRLIAPLAKRDLIQAWRVADGIEADSGLRGRAFFEFGRGLEGSQEDVGKWKSKITDKAEQRWFTAGVTAARADHGEIDLLLPPGLAGTKPGNVALVVMAEACQRRGLSWTAVDAARLIGDDDHALRDLTLAYIAQGLAETDPVVTLDVSRCIQWPLSRLEVLTRSGWCLAVQNDAAKPMVSREFQEFADSLAQEWNRNHKNLSMWRLTLDQLMPMWALIDAPSAGDYLIGHEPPDTQGTSPRLVPGMYEGLADSYARRDFAAAYAWGDKLDKPPLVKARFFYGLAEGSLDKPSSSTQYLQDLWQHHERPPSMSQFALYEH